MSILAYDYPLWGFFLSVMWLFLWVAWIMCLFHVIADIFRSDMGGIAKALWLIFVILAPFLGLLIYLIANGPAMQRRAIERAQQQEASFQSYVRQTAGTAGPADQLQQLAALHDAGSISDAEFEAGKAKILG
jgi:hypothetical protein